MLEFGGIWIIRYLCYIILKGGGGLIVRVGGKCGSLDICAIDYMDQLVTSEL